jgi:hypothetical protein
LSYCPNPSYQLSAHSRQLEGLHHGLRADS